MSEENKILSRQIGRFIQIFDDTLREEATPLNFCRALTSLRSELTIPFSHYSQSNVVAVEDKHTVVLRALLNSTMYCRRFTPLLEDALVAYILDEAERLKSKPNLLGGDALRLIELARLYAEGEIEGLLRLISVNFAQRDKKGRVVGGATLEVKVMQNGDIVLSKGHSELRATLKKALPSSVNFTESAIKEVASQLDSLKLDDGWRIETVDVRRHYYIHRHDAKNIETVASITEKPFHKDARYFELTYLYSVIRAMTQSERQWVADFFDIDLQYCNTHPDELAYELTLRERDDVYRALLRVAEKN